MQLFFLLHYFLNPLNHYLQYFCSLYAKGYPVALEAELRDNQI